MLEIYLCLISAEYFGGMITREIYPTGIYHVYNRGTLAMDIFRDQRDYQRFIIKLFEYKQKYPVELLAYCLMPNHFHLLVKEPEKGMTPEIANISFLMKVLLNAYAKYFSCKYKHSGNVFQGKYKSKFVDTESYYLHLKEYILDNLVRAGLVAKRSDWPYLGLDQFGQQALLGQQGLLTDKAC